MKPFILTLLTCLTFVTLNSQSVDLTRLKKAHEDLYLCRTSYNLNPAYLNDCIRKANEFEAKIRDGAALVRLDPIGVFKYNAEFGYLNFMNAEINQSTGVDSTIYFLKHTFKYIEKAREEYMAKGEIYEHSYISSEEVNALYDEVYGYLKKYGLHHIAKENEAFDWMPSFKPYRYSAQAAIPDNILHKDQNKNLGNVDSYLKGVLDRTGYDERSYFYYPNGFVLVTQMEQINEDGSSKNVPYRWSNAIKSNEWSLWNYLKALFTANPAFYRVFAFVVTDQPINVEQSMNRNQFVTNTIINKLPKELKDLPFTVDHGVTVLVYEFERSSSQEGVSLNTRSNLTGKMHLGQAKIMDYLH